MRDGLFRPSAHALKVIAGGDVPQLVESGTNISTPANLTLVQADGGAVRWLDDGNAPSATTGHTLADGESVTLYSDLNKVIFYIASAVEITFYSHKG